MWRLSYHAFNITVGLFLLISPNNLVIYINAESMIVLSILIDQLINICKIEVRGNHLKTGFISKRCWPPWDIWTYLGKFMVSRYKITTSLKPVSLVCGLDVSIAYLVTILWSQIKDLLVYFASQLGACTLSGKSYYFGIWKYFFNRNHREIDSPTLKKLSLPKKEIFVKKKTSRRHCKFHYGARCVRSWSSNGLKRGITWYFSYHMWS